MSVPGTLEEFLAQAGSKLNINAEKAFTETGAQIDDVTLIRDDEKVYISSGEPFFKSSDTRVRQYKVAVIGSGGVGKSCLSLRYVRSTFVDVYDPTIEDAFRHHTVVDGNACVLDILDTAGQEDMQMLRRQWIEDRDGFLMVYSMTDKTSFEDLCNFYELIEQVKEEQLDSNGVPLVLVANKSDLADSRKVTKEQGKTRAQEWNAGYVEASAKAGHNVTLAFEELVRKFEKLNPLPPEKKKSSICSLL